MCGNYRYWEGLTVQELRAPDVDDEWFMETWLSGLKQQT